MTRRNPKLHDRFVSEPIAPVAGSFTTPSMSVGEPGLPMRFRWRGVEYDILHIIKKWKTTGPCRNGSPEQYVRKHWFRVETADGAEMQIYFDRQARSKHSKKRWWLATISRNEDNI